MQSVIPKIVTALSPSLALGGRCVSYRCLGAGNVRRCFPARLCTRRGLLLHISVRLAVIIFAIKRLLWRIGDPPRLPEKTPLGPWMDRIGQLAYYTLYAL